VVEFSDPAQRRDCLASALNTEVLFSFMGSLVIRREKWLSVQPVSRFMGSCWGHVARLLAIDKISSGPATCLKYGWTNGAITTPF
jgi:abequosyltransferase